MQEPLKSGNCQLFRLDEFSLFAILSESPNPLKVSYDRSARKVAFPPHADNLALPGISYLDLSIHELLDESTQKKFDALSRRT
jgi:hypothetical protein